MSTSLPKNTEGDPQLFALRLARISTLTALGITDENYHARLFARQTDWLTCLINSANENLTYDLRIISHPNTENFMRGSLTVALLCSIRNASDDDAQKYASELKSLCEAFFDDEYVFELVTGETQLNALRSPFETNSVAEIARRADFLALDSLRNNSAKPVFGFVSSQGKSIDIPDSPEINSKQGATQESTIPGSSTKLSRQPASAVYHVYPFLVNPAQQNHLLKLLLLQACPLVISFRLQPTALSPDEQEFIEAQIALCERYGQLSLNNPTDKLEFLWPTLQQQARSLQRQLVRTLYSLKDNAALCRIQIATQATSIPQSVLDALGSSVTVQAGAQGNTEQLDSYLSGGYEIIHSKDVLETKVRSFQDLDLSHFYDGSAPSGARRLRYLFDAMEATSAFHFPAPTLDEPPGLPAKTSRTQPPPATMGDIGQCIGESHHNGRIQPVFLTPGDRRRHVYVVGQTGTGKTTMFESMILDDIRGGEGVCVLDPHGDLIEKLLSKVPQRRVKDVILFDPSDVDCPIGLNVLEYESEAQKYFLVQEILSILERLFDDKYSGSASVTGPLFYQHVRMILLLVMSNPDDIGTILQFHQVFNSPGYYKRFLPLRSPDPVLDTFIKGTLSRTDYLNQGSDNYALGSYVSNKFDGFVTDPMLRNIFGQQHSSINLRQIMDEGKILLVNLSKGRLGEVNSRFLGMFLIAKLQAAAMARASIAIERRRDFYLYVDEFQNLATLNFGTLLSEARKYRLNLILTNQYITQVDPRISSAISGNVGTLATFRVGSLDAEFLEREFVPVFNRYDLMQLPNFTSCVSTLIDGQVCRPFTMRNRLDGLAPDAERGKQIRTHSRKTYGRQRTIVTREILESLNYES